MDGVTRDRENGKYPVPSPAAIVTKIFIESAYKFYVANKSLYPIEVILSGMMAFGNSKIAEFNSKKQWDNDFFPGTVGIILAFCNPLKIMYAYIGDCYGAVINQKIIPFTRCQTEKIAKHKKNYSSIEIRNEICNNILHPYSYGVLNGSIKALSFVEYGEKVLLKNDKVILCTDGFSDIFTKLDIHALNTLYPSQLEKYSKSPDDKTLIMISGDNND